MKILISFILLFVFCLPPISGKAMNDKLPRTIKLEMENTLIINGMINPVTLSVIAPAMFGKRVLLSKEKTLYILLASGGGEYESSKVLLSLIRSLPNTEIICEYCASAAGMLFAASGQKRLVTDNSVLLMHEMYMNHITAKNFSDESLRNNLKKSSDEFNKIMYSIIGISKVQYESHIIDTQWVVNGSEIIGLHLADELVRTECSPSVKYLNSDICSN